MRVWGWILPYFVPFWLTAQSDRDSLRSADHLIDAEKYFLIEEYASAMQALDLSLAADASNSAAHLKYAQCHAVKAYFPAKKHLQAAISFQPSNPHYYLVAAKIALQYEQLTEAISFYEALLLAAPEPAYHKDLAALYLQDGQFEQALATYEALEQRFGYTKALGLQRLHIAQQRALHGEALQEAERLQRTFSEDEGALLCYAQLLKEQKGAQSALRYLKTLPKAAQKGHLLAPLAIKCHLSLQQWAQSEALLRILWQDPLFSLEKKMDFIQLPAPIGWWPYLEVLCDSLLVQYPSDVATLRTIAACFARISPQKASKVYANMLELGAISLLLFKEIITLELFLGRNDKATAHLHQAMHYYPQHPQLYLLEGRTRYLKKDYKEAQVELKRGIALSMDPLVTSQLYLCLGDVQQAASQGAALAVEWVEKSKNAHGGSLGAF